MQKDKEDTIKINHLNLIATILKSTDLDSSVLLSDQARRLSTKLKWKKGEANSLINVGVTHYYRSNYAEAMSYYETAAKVYEELLNSDDSLQRRAARKGIAVAYGNMGTVKQETGDYITALNYHLKSLALNESVNNETGIAINTGNIGVCYSYQSQYSRALFYHLKALKLQEKLGNQPGIARQLTMIGTLFYYQNDYQKAQEYYDRALKLYETLEHSDGIASNLGNLGNVYRDWAELKKLKNEEKKKYLELSLAHYLRALNIYTQIGNKGGKAALFGNIGLIYSTLKNDSALKFLTEALQLNRETGDKYGVAINQKCIGLFYSRYAAQPNYKEAERCLKIAIETDHEIGALHEECEAENFLSEVYVKTRSFEKALDHYKKYISIRDSLKNDESIKKQTQLEMQFGFDKKQTADSVKVAEEKKVSAAELRTEKNKSYTLYGGLALVLVFSGFIFNRFRVTQKQKIIIEKQKETVEEQKLLVEEKNKDILDSIHYAERIQRSLLPNEKYIGKHIK